MDAFSPCLSLWWIVFGYLCSAASGDQKNITAECGQNITLTCRVPNNNIIVVEWSRADLKEEYVLIYRDGHLYADGQHPSFKNRVDLQDRQMKDGDVSLILKNVTINDTGTYECRVFMSGTNRRKRAHLKTAPISIINLSVVDPPGQTGGHTEDGVGRGHCGLVASVFLFLLVFIVVLVIATKPSKKNFSNHLPSDETADSSSDTSVTRMIKHQPHKT